MSAQGRGSLPIAVTNEIARSRIDGSVAEPRTTSTRGSFATGLRNAGRETVHGASIPWTAAPGRCSRCWSRAGRRRACVAQVPNNARLASGALDDGLYDQIGFGRPARVGAESSLRCSGGTRGLEAPLEKCRCPRQCRLYLRVGTVMNRHAESSNRAPCAISPPMIPVPATWTRRTSCDFGAVPRSRSRRKNTRTRFRDAGVTRSLPMDRASARYAEVRPRHGAPIDPQWRRARGSARGERGARPGANSASQPSPDGCQVENPQVNRRAAYGRSGANDFARGSIDIGRGDDAVNQTDTPCFPWRYGSSRQHEIQSHRRAQQTYTTHRSTKPWMNAELHLRQSHAALVALRGDSVVASQASSSPPPARSPCMAATVGQGRSSNRLISAWARPANVSTCSALCSPRNSEMSAPAANPVCLADLITTPTGGFARSDRSDRRVPAVPAATGHWLCCSPCQAGASDTVRIVLNVPVDGHRPSILYHERGFRSELGEHRNTRRNAPPEARCGFIACMFRDIPLSLPRSHGFSSCLQHSPVPDIPRRGSPTRR